MLLLLTLAGIQDIVLQEEGWGRIMREEVGWKKAGDSVPGRRLEIDRDV